MNKIMFVGFLSIILALSGCMTKSNEDLPDGAKSFKAQLDFLKKNGRLPQQGDDVTYTPTMTQDSQAQKAQTEYQRKQLELQRQQAEALEEANNPLSIQNQLRSLQDMNNRNKPVNCSTVGGVTTCF